MIPEMPDGHVDRFDDQYENAVEPGVSHFLLASISCFSFDEDDLDAREVLDILLKCYDGSLLRETEEQVTDVFEQTNARARAIIEFQKDSIAGFANGA